MRLRRTTPLRRPALTLAVGALGLYVGVALAGSAAAFDGTCTGTACTGSGTHTFSRASACTPGINRFFVDSFLPADAQRPHVTSFRVTPSPPCTGATVSGPSVDPWPASTLDPNKRPSGVPSDSGVFRIGWTINVPEGSKPNGLMKAAWSVAWTEPDSTNTTTTDFRPPRITHDFVVQIKVAPKVRISRAGTLAVIVVVSNEGPDASPAVATGDSGALVFHSSPLFPIVKAPRGCTKGKTNVNCGVRQLALHGTQSFHFVVRVGRPKAFTLSAKINLAGCYVEEAACLNNQAFQNITTH
jgi:hypothetical protein